MDILNSLAIIAQQHIQERGPMSEKEAETFRALLEIAKEKEPVTNQPENGKAGNYGHV